MLTALVSDPDALLAGRYLCQDTSRDELRRLITEDWKMMNNYIPDRLNISFRKRGVVKGVTEIITALEG